MVLVHFMKHKLLKTLDHIVYGSVSVTFPDGAHYQFKGKFEGAHGTCHLHHWDVITSLIAKGDIGFAESYRDGLWDTDDLGELLTFILQNASVLEGYFYGGTLMNIASRFLYLFRRNSVTGSKRNIHSHYDLGNAFYSLWLDKSMTYSSALFDEEGQSLEQAQRNKYDRILDQLQASSGNLLEVGCGWGGFAERAVQRGDYDLKAITISDAQHGFATERLGNRATIALEDYRRQEGKYDHIVSIEMFEAVGESFWPIYFQKMKSLLKDKGKAVIQTISISEAYAARYQKTGDMIRTFIFPGGMLPSFTRFKTEVEKAGLRVTDHLAFGKDYALTLKHWLDGFEQNIAHIKALDFDERFIRLWRFYLAVCMASFTVERTNVLQVELEHA